MQAVQINRTKPIINVDEHLMQKGVNLGINAARLKEELQKASEIIPQVWPLKNFIACNPLLGFENLPFEEALKAAGSLFAKASAGLNAKVNLEMIKWCSAFLDEGQATIQMPSRELGFYKAWRELAPYDHNLTKGEKKNEAWLSQLPLNPEETLAICLEKMGVSSASLKGFFEEQLNSLPGWAGYIKWKELNQNPHGKNPISLLDYMAVRVAILAILRGESKATNTEALPQTLLSEAELQIQKDWEKRYFEHLRKLIQDSPTQSGQQQSCASNNCDAPEAHLVFCIDVRSEPLRRKIEAQGNFRTYGFAGFFGLPVRIHDYNSHESKDCCPALLKPHYDVHEKPVTHDKHEISLHKRNKRFVEYIKGFYNELKYNFGTPFALIETLGPWCGLLMAFRTLIPNRYKKAKEQLSANWKLQLASEPNLSPCDSACGIPLADQATMGEAMLRFIGLTNNFGKWVILCGHGSTTENNPYASALDCGACGGNHGGPNAKIQAAILNNRNVREILKNKGIHIPDDTCFIAGEHDTTTDAISLFLPPSLTDKQKAELNAIQQKLFLASEENRKTRLKSFSQDASEMVGKEGCFEAITRRSANWSEVRPEWGLAGNAAFIIAPRVLTKNADLEGRCFLHSYEWDQDPECKILETILTAPVIVAQWISTQYLFSTINNTQCGSGSKITQNVTGKIGVMQGNGSDLMHGLPKQSVYASDTRRQHQPIRLRVVVRAPKENVKGLIEKHQVLQNLFYNEWILLAVLDPKTGNTYTLSKQKEWQIV